MLSVEIRIDTGFPPHSFLVVVGPDGVKRGYGFAPDPSGLVAPGQVRDDTLHPADVFSGKVEITQAQYWKLMDYIAVTTTNPPDYSAFQGSQCSTWVVNALAQMGMVPVLGVPNMQPKNILVDFVESLIFQPWMQSIGIEENNFLTGIQKLFHQAEITKSPLVLDLNGDGVSTVAMNAGIHFDQNNNRFAELSGWVNKDDGLLVRDLNGNGQIDGGGELFGNNTLLANGQKAANGFASLAEVDANRDGKVDSTEAAAAGIKIWKDANQNGITDAGELLTLKQAGISSLATGYTVGSTVDAQGNTLGLTGSYTATDGTRHAMDDVWFATDTARTIEMDSVAVSAQIAALPDIAGFGNV
ncbi:MAG: hypothetical protein NTY60_00095, partial [Proteobacteria bacterium]|nr:hypothetical protein [Pseudomonadota bacterium]